MSNTSENRSQNSAEEFQLTGWEIQPYVARETVVDYRSPVLHRELIRTLKKMISQAISPLKVAPQAQNTDDSASDMALVVVPTGDEEAAGRRSGRTRTSTIVGELRVTFQLPEDCIANRIDMDQLPDLEGNINLVRRFSFRERLEGWHVECRQRPNKTYDRFYRFQGSSRRFRSITEVVKFILYERYPNTFRRYVRIQANNQDLNNTTMAVAVNEEGTKTEEQIVREFLAEAYNNLMNLVPQNIDCEEDVMTESEYQGFISDEGDSNEGVEDETAEDLLETMYNDLVDISDTKMSKKEGGNTTENSRKKQKCSDAPSCSSVPPSNTMEGEETSNTVDQSAAEVGAKQKEDQKTVVEEQGLQAEFQEGHQAIAEEVLVNLEKENSGQVEEANMQLSRNA